MRTSVYGTALSKYTKLRVGLVGTIERTMTVNTVVYLTAR
jgi:hypothetical protein